MKSLTVATLLAITIHLIMGQPGNGQPIENPGDAFEPGKVLAIVGGEPIFVGDLLFDVNQFITKNAPHAPESAKPDLRRQVMKRMLPSAIEQRLLLIGVKNELPPEADFDDIVENASSEFDKQALEKMMEFAGVNSPAQFDAHLRAQGSSLRKLRNTWTQSQFVRALLSEKIRANVDVSHRELLDYYHEHLDDYKTKARAKWEQIMVRFERFPSKEEARKAITELGDKVVFGASFSETAKNHSQGYRAHDGGQHDWTSRGSLVLKKIDHAIFNLPVGKLSDVIESKQGFHIVRVQERENDTVTSFRDAQIEIKKKIETERRMAAYESHLAELRKKIPVEIMNSDQRTTTAANRLESKTRHR